MYAYQTIPLLWLQVRILLCTCLFSVKNWSWYASSYNGVCSTCRVVFPHSEIFGCRTMSGDRKCKYIKWYCTKCNVIYIYLLKFHFELQVLRRELEKSKVSRSLTFTVPVLDPPHGLHVVSLRQNITYVKVVDPECK